MGLCLPQISLMLNEAWIAIRVNEGFIFVKDDPYGSFLKLLDAASAYVAGVNEAFKCS